MKRIAMIVAVVLVIAVVASLVACGEKSPVIGTWNSNDAEGASIVFKEDGTGSMGSSDFALTFSYTEKDKKLELTRVGEKEKIVFEYTINGDQLSLKSEDGSTLTYTKAK